MSEQIYEDFSKDEFNEPQNHETINYDNVDIINDHTIIHKEEINIKDLKNHDTEEVYDTNVKTEVADPINEVAIINKNNEEINDNYIMPHSSKHENEDRGSLTQINKDEAVTENITNNDNQNPPQQISSDPHDVEIKDECPQENTQTKEKKPKFKSKNDTSQKANVKSDNGKVKKEKKAIKNDVVKSSPKLNEKHAKKSQEKIFKKSPPKKKKSQSLKMSNSIVKGSSSVILRKQRKVNREEFEKYSNMVIKKPFTQEPKSVETPKKNENRRKKRKVNQLEFKKYALMFNKKNPVLKKKIPKKQHKVVNQIQQISSPLEHPRIVLRKTVRRVDIEEYEKYSMMMNKKVRLPKKKSVNIQKTSKKNSKIRKNTKKNLRTLSKRVSSRRIRNHVELPTTRIRRNVGKVDKEYEKYCLMLNQKIKRKKH